MTAASKQRAILLMGPTASGKTAASLALAQHYDIEIISVDSALIYRGMDIGSAKPDAAEQAICPHHLIDIIAPDERYAAARFYEDAWRLIAEINARGRIPVLAGGSMMYFKALREGLSDLPQADAALRAEIDAAAIARGWPALHAELAALDPHAAARLHATDSHRIQRPLEIVPITGRPLAESYAQQEAPPPELNALCIALQPQDRSWLHARIAARFDIMLAAGLENELRQLRQNHPLDIDMPSMRCVGYRQMWEYMDGLCDHATMREKGIAATRQLAKRQITWLRQFSEKWPDLIEINCQQDNLSQVVLDECARWLSVADHTPN